MHINVTSMHIKKHNAHYLYEINVILKFLEGKIFVLTLLKNVQFFQVFVIFLFL